MRTKTTGKISIGDLVKVDSYNGEIIVLVTGEGRSNCNSDGEEWWTEWDSKNMATDEYYKLSSRHLNFHNINQ